MRQFRFLLLSLFLLSIPQFANATEIIIDFEGIADSTPVTNQFAGLVFTDATVITAGISLNEYDFPPHSGVNVVFDDGGPMSISFTDPVTSFGGYFTYTTMLTLTGFDLLNNPLIPVTSAFSSNYVSSGMGSPNEFLSLTSSIGISSVTITGDPGGASFVMDDATYVPVPSTTVPEPGTLFLLLPPVIGTALVRKRLLKQ